MPARSSAKPPAAVRADEARPVTSAVRRRPAAAVLLTGLAGRATDGVAASTAGMWGPTCLVQAVLGRRRHYRAAGVQDLAAHGPAAPWKRRSGTTIPNYCCQCVGEGAGVPIAPCRPRMSRGGSQWMQEQSQHALHWPPSLILHCHCSPLRSSSLRLLEAGHAPLRPKQLPNTLANTLQSRAGALRPPRACACPAAAAAAAASCRRLPPSPRHAWLHALAVQEADSQARGPYSRFQPTSRQRTAEGAAAQWMTSRCR